jgi:hypothetical protein
MADTEELQVKENCRGVNSMKKWMPVYWVVWVLGLFLIPELIAVFNGTKGDTFSETWWNVFDTNNNEPTVLTYVGVAVTFITGVWLIGHLSFGLWGGPRKLPKLDGNLLNELHKAFASAQRNENGKFVRNSTDVGLEAVYHYLEDVTKRRSAKSRVVS